MGGGQIPKHQVNNLHFGGFEKVEKSRAEVMKEIIQKSKFHRHERQKAKDEDETLREELDEELGDIRSLLKVLPNKRSSLPSQSKLFQNSMAPPSSAKSGEEEEEEAYDKNVRELVYDKRSRPSDRTKTEEEIATEEKERLERAERHRLRRMRGIDSDTEDSDEDESKKKRRRSEDLENLAGSGLDEDDEDDDLEEENGEEEERSGLSSGENELEVSLKEAPNNLEQVPFTLAAPTTQAEFLQIVQNLGPADQATVVLRIRTLHHIRLAPQNKEKLEVSPLNISDY